MANKADIEELINLRILQQKDEWQEEYEDKNILVFNRRKKLNKWYEKEFNKKIEL